MARVMQEGGLGTFLFDLLTPKEEEIDDVTRELRFNIPFLADRMVTVTKWLRGTDATKDLNVGYFGASTGGGAAIVAAARLKGDPQVKAVVSRGGRPDLAGSLMRELKRKIWRVTMKRLMMMMMECAVQASRCVTASCRR